MGPKWNELHGCSEDYLIVNLTLQAILHQFQETQIRFIVSFQFSSSARPYLVINDNEEVHDVLHLHFGRQCVITLACVQKTLDACCLKQFPETADVGCCTEHEDPVSLICFKSSAGRAPKAYSS